MQIYSRYMVAGATAYIENYWSHLYCPLKAILTVWLYIIKITKGSLFNRQSEYLSKYKRGHDRQ